MLKWNYSRISILTLLIAEKLIPTLMLMSTFALAAEEKKRFFQMKKTDILPEQDCFVMNKGERIMDTYEGPSEEELYRMEKLKKNTLYGSAGKPNNLMSTDGELKQWQRDIMNDPVNHPSHYTDGKIEVIDFIEDKKLGFHLGNAVKYIARAGKKDPNKEVEDLKKAIWYINRRIANISGDTDGDSEIINQEIKPLTSFEADLIKWKEGAKND